MTALVSSLTINPSDSCSCSYRVRPAINGLWLLRTASCPITSTYWSKEIIRLLTFVSSCVSSSSDRRLRGSKEVEQRSGSEATSSTYSEMTKIRLVSRGTSSKIQYEAISYNGLRTIRISAQ